MKKLIHLLSLCAIAFSFPASANTWINDTNVTQIGTYQKSSGHFFWLAAGVPDECKLANPANPTLIFYEDSGAGKSLLTVLTSALVANRKVSVNVSGCEVVEVYIK